MILQPQQDFPIVRQIANHLDSNTYYVQAIVRDADGTILDTVNLEDKGDQRFQRRYRVPVDRSGQGAYISIVTSVYTDSNYTTKSSNYGDEENTYLIFDRVTPAMRGGGSNIDYGAVRRILGEELDKREKEEKEIEFPEMPDVPEYSAQFQQLTQTLAELGRAINRIPTKATDLTHVLTGIQNLATAIAEKEVTPETDLAPVIEEVRMVFDMVSAELDMHRSAAEDDREQLKTTIVDTIQDGMENTEFIQEVAVRPKRMKRKEEEQEATKPAFNIRKLVQ